MGAWASRAARGRHVACPRGATRPPEIAGNKRCCMQHGAVLKVVKSPIDAALIPDGAALSAYQYFENVRNFLVVVQELGIPNFEAFDLDQSYCEWKQSGGNGVLKFGGNVKPA
ncbi:P-loop nucleoside triphosphate hydrolases superfamily protein with CH domain-containing protein [Perilla frutescens var. hirtella]|uniref:P-loop nucleoside triphosphate hydrolases superfamily protein with CH domain-containing protein n=1 Tax=Perilla frutescens var. hirtella TaxID=608512 RepID=A0AAD4ITG5_PERFH|nr:P-loop nucleoside triphosphate hydrolases superfamily protein with CH domain-containing protein [Perilla frutescens var. hirtella]